MTDQFLLMLFLMLAGHALADGPLQPPEISAGKRAPKFSTRAQFLLIHGFIHGGAVAIVTQLWWLGLAETIVHIAIDRSKGRRWIGWRTDQALHVICKVIWALIAVDQLLIYA